MCGPAAIPLAIAVVSSATQVYSAREQSQQQTSLAKQNAANALRAQNDAYDAQAAQANQRRDAAGQASYRNAIDAARARATARVAAGESGMSGTTADQLVNQITGQEGANYADLAANQSYAEDQRSREAAGIATQTQGRINSTPAGSFNPVIGLLQIGAAGASAYYGSKKP